MNSLAAAKSSYSINGKKGRVLGADPHQLITILLEELVNLLDEICLIHAKGNTETYIDQQVMAQSILDSLIVSLDMEKGGALAINLRSIYAHVRKIIGLTDPGNKLPNVRAAHRIISEISDAWLQINQPSFR